MTTIMFKFDTEKKHSIRYFSSEPNMTIYVPKDVLKKLSADSLPKALDVTLAVAVTEKPADNQ